MLWVFNIGCVLTGGWLDLYIAGKGTGEYNYVMVIPTLGGAILGFMIYHLFSSGTKKKRAHPRGG